jgi:hypothetical protein
MSRSEPESGERARGRGAVAAGGIPRLPTPAYGGYVVLLAIVVLVLITTNTLLSDSKGVVGLAPGQAMPPFALPLAVGSLSGDANVATRAHEGEAGRRPACTVRGPQLLNVCQLYEQGPVVLAVFVDGSSCPAVLSEMQALVPSFPGVRFAAVAIEGSRGDLRRLVRSRGLTLPVGIDSDGALVALYKVDSCPQLTFAYPGGVVQGKTVVGDPSPAALSARVSELVAASRARGWRGPAA